MTDIKLKQALKELTYRQQIEICKSLFFGTSLHKVYDLLNQWTIEDDRHNKKMENLSKMKPIVINTDGAFSSKLD